MKRLALLRHAEAEAARAGLPDVKRALTARGRTEALDAAQCVAIAGLRIDALLVSPAVRTRETALIVAAELDLSDELRFEAALYLGSLEALWLPLRGCQESLGTVLMVGHNPALSALARQLHRGGGNLELRTAGLCSIEFDQDVTWKDLRPECATVFTMLR
ncbi:MAG: histidine phosphatase family protein [Steroidobacteraceae bacterium]|jgi:phosphohistidine phosphatase